MKSRLLTAFAVVASFLALSATSPVFAAADNVPLTEAVIKKLDPAAGTVVLTHGPIENIGMPGMTMGFALKEGLSLKGLQPGDKLRVRIEDIRGTLTVVRIERPAPAK